MSRSLDQTIRTPGWQERARGAAPNELVPVASVGDLLMRVHRGAWRPSPAPLEVSLDELAEMLPVLLLSGSVGVVWPRLRHRDYGAAGVALAETYRELRARDADARRALPQVMRRFELAGVEPVLVKGWAIGRLYREPAIRPLGDIDVVVPPARYARAACALRDMHADGIGFSVDLQRDDTWRDRPGAAFRRRVESIQLLDGTPARILCAEDQLRVLCLHFLRHGGRRPLWLVDIALALEARPGAFDWSRCLGADGVEAGWVATTLHLAHEMLGADLVGTPPAVRSRPPPRWLAPEILRQWERYDPIPHEVVPELARNPKGMTGTLRRRWPSPISAFVTCRLPLTGMPLLPVQLAAYGTTIVSFAARRLPGQLARYRHRGR